MTARCSARPDDLLSCAGEIDQIGAALRSAVASFDGAMEFLLLRSRWFWAAVRWSDPLWSLTRELDDMGAWVGSVASAFEAAGGRGTAGRSDVVTTDASIVDAWLHDTSWRPVDQSRAGGGGDWAAAVFGTRCVSWGNAGYQGSGFLVGPDGRVYPLVAPHVVRGGTTYNADDGLVPGHASVLDLDGRDPGWTTVYEQIGVERWRDAPSLTGRILAGVGATAAGPPRGSTQSDVGSVIMRSGFAPTLSTGLTPRTAPAASPPVYTPPAPPAPPPNAPDIRYPVGQTSVAAGGMNLAPVVLDGLVGGASADLGSHDAYDVVLQQNTDGRIRALYRRVFVGFDDDGEPTLSSVYVTGPDRNEQVPITYAPSR